MRRRIPIILFVFAFVLCSLALLEGPNPIVYVALSAAYLLQWLALVAEAWFLTLRSRPRRILAYIISLFGNSLIPVFEAVGAAQLPFRGLIPVVWGLFSWFSFIPVLYLTLESDRDLTLDVRLTPFGFSLLGAFIHWLWGMAA